MGGKLGAKRIGRSRMLGIRHLKPLEWFLVSAEERGLAAGSDHLGPDAQRPNSLALAAVNSASVRIPAVFRSPSFVSCAIVSSAGAVGA